MVKLTETIGGKAPSNVFSFYLSFIYLNYFRYFDHILSLPPDSSISSSPPFPTNFICTFSQNRTYQKNKKKNTKTKLKTHKKAWSQFCMNDLLIDISACPRMWLIHPLILHWRKRIFPFLADVNCK